MAQIEEKNTSKGKITCDKKILLSIISLATKEISGVADLVDTPLTRAKRLFNKRDSKGVKIKISGSGKITIDVYIKVFAGVSIPDICYRIQENIKNNIASMIELKAGKINVHIVGVNFNREKEEGNI